MSDAAAQLTAQSCAVKRSQDFPKQNKIKSPKAANQPIRPVGTVCEAVGWGKPFPQQPEINCLRLGPADASVQDPEHRSLTCVLKHLLIHHPECAVASQSCE